jgi:NAD(P)H-dependent FMN reductase
MGRRQHLKTPSIFCMVNGSTKRLASSPMGGALGTRAVESLRLVMAELQVATVRAQVGLSAVSPISKTSAFLNRPPGKKRYLHAMLDQLIAWGGALKALREKQAESTM